MTSLQNDELSFCGTLQVCIYTDREKYYKNFITTILLLLLSQVLLALKSVKF